MDETNLTLPDSTDVLVAGGGVAGLYCAWRLGQTRPVVLMELADRWGGRMETAVMDRFIAEYGPMRFEASLQPKFASLVKTLGLELVPFAGPSAGQIAFPKYDLTSDELMQDGREPSSIQLLRRGLLLIMGQKLTPADRYGEQNPHKEWLNGLTETNYQDIRRDATVPGSPSVKLWEVGFWNALSTAGVLSHQALMKIRDTGTFYHMIPDNLNAAEWTIWWLRALTDAGASMSTIAGGTGRITKEMLKKMPENVRCMPGTELLALAPAGDVVACRYRGGTEPLRARHVILALPQAPLKLLDAPFPDAIRADLDAVNGFPMIKVFFVTKTPWWKPETPPQTRANRMPTREVHYYRRRGTPDDGHGMALIYSDRPATEYWKIYVKKPVHDRAEIDGNPELLRETARWLAAEAHAAVQAASGVAAGQAPPALVLHEEALQRFSGLSIDDIAADIEQSAVTYGIRDWARAPYGAANHSWVPGVKSWEVIERMRAFPLRGSTASNVHICGEAYSSYSGFIEGALRSADLALETIK